MEYGLEGWPEPELGWVVFDNFEGKGIVFEAAKAVRSWAYSKLGFTTITSEDCAKKQALDCFSKKTECYIRKKYHNDNMGQCYMYRHPYQKTRENTDSIMTNTAAYQLNLIFALPQGSRY